MIEYPLVTAARFGNLECVETLLKAGAKIDGIGASGGTALTAAISRAFNTEESTIVRTLRQISSSKTPPQRINFFV